MDMAMMLRQLLQGPDLVLGCDRVDLLSEALMSF